MSEEQKSWTEQDKRKSLTQRDLVRIKLSVEVGEEDPRTWEALRIVVRALLKQEASLSLGAVVGSVCDGETR